MEGQKKRQLVIPLIFIFVVSTLAVIQAKSNLSEKKEIIEVCSNGIVYVPPGTKLVKCHGKIHKVIRVTPYQRGGEGCLCPDCCFGECAIIVTCDPAGEGLSYSESNGNGFEPGSVPDGNRETLCYLWIYCE